MMYKRFRKLQRSLVTLISAAIIMQNITPAYAVEIGDIIEKSRLAVSSEDGTEAVIVTPDEGEEETEPVATPSEGEEEETEPVVTPSEGEEETEPVVTPSEGEEETEPVVTPSEGEEETEPVVTPSEGEEETDPVVTPSEGEEETEPVVTPSEGEEETEPVVTPSEGEEETEPVVTPSEGEEEETEPVVTPSEGEEEKDPVVTPSEGEEEKDPVVTPSEGEEEETEPVVTPSEGEEETEPVVTPSEGEETEPVVTPSEGEEETEPVVTPSEGEEKTYDISVAEGITNGSISVDKSSAKAGETIQVTIAAAKGYEVNSVIVSTADGTISTSPTEKGLSFVMPEKAVSISADFKTIEYEFRISSNASSKGWVDRVWINDGEGVYAERGTAKYRDYVNIFVKVSEGCQIDRVTYIGETGEQIELLGEKKEYGYQYYFQMPAENTEIELTVSDINYSIVKTGDTDLYTVSKVEAIKGDEVSIALTGKSGYRYKEGSLEVSNTDGKTAVEVNRTTDGYSFIMPAGQVRVYAEFEKAPFTIAVEAKEGGSAVVKKAVLGELVTITDGYIDEVYTVLVSTNDGYECSGVTVNGKAATKADENIYTFTMPGENVKILVTFIKKKFPVVVSSNVDNAIEVTESAAWDETIAVKVKKVKGYKLTSLKVSGATILASTDEPVLEEKTFTVNTGAYEQLAASGEISINAAFARIEYVITSSVDGDEGILEISVIDTELVKKNNSTSAFMGDTVEIKSLKAFGGRHFTDVRVFAEGKEIAVTKNHSEASTTKDDRVLLSASFVMPAADVRVIGYYAGEQYLIITSPADGTAFYKDNTVTYLVNGVEDNLAEAGDEVTINVKPDKGVKVSRIVVTDSNNRRLTVTTGKFTMPASRVKVKVTYDLCSYNVKITATEEGLVTASQLAGIYGAYIEITVSAYDGYIFNGLKITSKDGDVEIFDGDFENAFGFYMPDSDVLVTAIFDKIEEEEPETVSYNVIVVPSDNGLVTVNKQKAYAGEKIILSAEADEGYTFDSYNVTDKDNKEVLVSENGFVMPASDVTVSANFTGKKISITGDELIEEIPVTDGEIIVPENYDYRDSAETIEELSATDQIILGSNGEIQKTGKNPTDTQYAVGLKFGERDKAQYDGAKVTASQIILYTVETVSGNKILTPVSKSLYNPKVSYKNNVNANVDEYGNVRTTVSKKKRPTVTIKFTDPVLKKSDKSITAIFDIYPVNIEKTSINLKKDEVIIKAGKKLKNGNIKNATLQLTKSVRLNIKRDLDSLIITNLKTGEILEDSRDEDFSGVVIDKKGFYTVTLNAKSGNYYGSKTSEKFLIGFK